ncbi:Kinesin- protein 12 [Phlyctochytrium bullatum]|nr:Kinesin- protein 12 [Phlyctochytrium bullatum]
MEFYLGYNQQQFHQQQQQGVPGHGHGQQYPPMQALQPPLYPFGPPPYYSAYGNANTFGIPGVMASPKYQPHSQPFPFPQGAYPLGAAPFQLPPIQSSMGASEPPSPLLQPQSLHHGVPQPHLSAPHAAPTRLGHQPVPAQGAPSPNFFRALGGANSVMTDNGGNGTTVGPSGVRVVVRVRPRNDMEAQRDGLLAAVECHEDRRTVLIRTPQTGEASGQSGGAGVGTLKGLTFSRVCPENARQEDVFRDCGVAEMVCQALEGYSATIFAFGQTGSGKTFTITGPEQGWDHDNDMAGIIPRSLQYLYQVMEERLQEQQDASEDGRPSVQFKVSAAYLEIYNEQVQDLLSPSGTSLPIRWNAARGFYVENLCIVECGGYGDCLTVLEEGLKNRKTGSHLLNEHSSRSHSIMTIYLTTTTMDQDDGKPLVKHGRISFVDLAGSEKVKSSKATGDTLHETLNINKSLLTLDPKRREGHIPYRDSKLTMLLSDSLGGHGIALMIACISPSALNFHETLKTLRYAQRARRIRNKPLVLVDPVLDEVVQLKREVKGLRRENAALRARVEDRQRGLLGSTMAAAGLPPSGMQQMGAMPRLGRQQSNLSIAPSAPDFELRRNPSSILLPPVQPLEANASSKLPRPRPPSAAYSEAPSNGTACSCKECEEEDKARQREVRNGDDTLKQRKAVVPPIPVRVDRRKGEGPGLVSSRKTNRSSQKIPASTKSSPAIRQRLPNALPPLPHNPTINEVEGFADRNRDRRAHHRRDASTSTRTLAKSNQPVSSASSMSSNPEAMLLPLGTLKDVTAVKGLIMRDVEALDREIGRMTEETGG